MRKKSLTIRVAEWVATTLTEHTRWITTLACAITLIGALFASRLTLDTSFSALLPEGTPEVQEISELRQRIGGSVELIIAVGGPSKERLIFAKTIVETLRKRPWIRRADVEFPVDFFLDRRFQLAPLPDLKKFKASLDNEIKRVKRRANPFYVDLDDEEGTPRPWAEIDRKAEQSAATDLLKKHFISADNKYLFVRILPRGNISDMGAGAKLLAQIKDTVRRAGPRPQNVSLRFAGGLPLNQEQHQRMGSDLRRASILAFMLVLLLLTLYIRRIEAPIVLALPLVVGLVLTFGAAQLIFGQLNLVSGFLVAALVGLGIDFEIHLYLRYLEQLGTGGSPRQAIAQAIRSTFPGCTTAALTTSATFFSMRFSQFRGFSEFGTIAGAGVLITLITTYATLPPLALWLSSKSSKAAPRRIPFASLRRRPALAMVGIGIIFSISALWSARDVRYHSDFQKLRGSSPTVAFSDAVDKAFGGSLAPAALLVDTIDEVHAVEARIADRLRDPHSNIKRYLSLASMLPRPSSERTRTLKEMEKSLKTLPRHRLRRSDRKRVDEALRKLRIKPWSLEDIPAAYQQQFRTIDQKSMIVLIWPRFAMHGDDDVIAWGDELNALQGQLRKQGIQATILDENRIAARVLRQMKEDSPRVLAYAGIAVCLLLGLDFRSLRSVVLVAGCLALGMLWFLGLIPKFGLEINVFNQAILPSLLGLGLDNAVHLQHRYQEEGPGSLPLVVSTTGSASLLASATTAIGFGAAISAQHYGIQSMGWLAILGFTSTFIATTLFFPALLRLLERPASRGSNANRPAATK